MGKEWINVNEVGQLYLEKVLVTFDVPILFVCVDYENRKYLCLNVSDENDKYVIGETNNRELIDMLTNQITMESAFRKSVNNRVIIAEYDSENEKIITNIEEAGLISSDLLPKEGAFFELSNNMISEYIAFLKKQLISIEINDFYEKKTFTIKPCAYHAYFSYNEKAVIESGRMMLTDAKDNCSYDIKHSHKMIA